MSFFKRRHKHTAPDGPREINTVMIANRGEIAVRVIRTLRELGLFSVAVYSDQDMMSQACDMADQAIALGGTATAQTYLSPEALIDAAKKSDADAIHPGYGFLSENADFAQAVLDAGLVWIGPSPQAIRALGDKISARSIAGTAEVPVIPGGQLPASVNEARDEIIGFAGRNGYPVLMKKADAGGGRGITRFDSDSEVTKHFNALGSETSMEGCFVEKMVLHARHVETQCARDSHGSFEVVTTRDCSVQRRNQKVVEEAPAPYLPERINEALHIYSRALFEAVDYVGIGTCEFLVTGDQKVYFLEVNPRLQVEHTVSEEVAGIDLVAEQIRIADGKPLSKLPASRGHSFEVRITSEDPANDLMPTTGTVRSIVWPAGPGIRVDGFIREGDCIGSDYDSLIAKLIVTGSNRKGALARLERALNELRVEGIAASSLLLKSIITHPDFCGPDSPQADAKKNATLPDHAMVWPREKHAFNVYTKWFEDSGILQRAQTEIATQTPRSGSGSTATDAGQATNPLDQMKTFTIELDGKRATLKVPRTFFGRPAPASADNTPSPARRQLLRRKDKRRDATNTDSSSPSLTAPIQATVVRVAVEQGAHVEAGDLVVVLESMKMEKPIYAHEPGVVDAIRVAPGDTVKAGDVLVALTPTARLTTEQAKG